VGDFVVVFYCAAPEEADGPAIGVVASKRVGNAVRRNRAKRLLRTAARSVAHKFNYPDLWVVLIAKSSIAQRTSHEVQDDIERALTLEGLLSGDT